MRWMILLLVLGSLVAQESDRKVTAKNVQEPVYSAWLGDATCGGLHVSMWSDGKGWHEADCMEVAQKLGELRDVRSVSVQYGPDIPGMLAYPQYEHDFRIKREDFVKAQAQCRTVLNEGYAVEDVLAHCRKVVAGTVPFGLRLER